MLTEIQKDRINQRFSLFREHMDTNGKDETIMDAVKAITAQMDGDERWICAKLEAAYTAGSINALMQVLIDPD